MVSHGAEEAERKVRFVYVAEEASLEADFLISWLGGKVTPQSSRAPAVRLVGKVPWNLRWSVTL
jgi:hypothetical protein